METKATKTQKQRPAPGATDNGLWLPEYDPNLWRAKHTVEVRLAQWKWGITVKTTVNGNTHGESILRCAIDNVCEELAEKGCSMVTPNDGPLIFDANDPEHTEDDYKEMVVGVRVVAHERET